MRTIRLAVGVVRGCVGVAWGQEWKPAENPIMTPWAEKVDPKSPLPEYPRPQMVRKDWVNLNGLWEYAIVGKGEGKPAAWQGKILVPFAVESALSGVKKPVTAEQRLWYRRTFTRPDVSGGKRVLLHFGAVDAEAQVWVNGKEVGSNKGGYHAFRFDITEAVKEGENELVVAAFDPTGAGYARGKQHLPAMARPSGIFYTPTTGIWQTVWMEAVPKAYVGALKITPDVDAGEVEVTVGMAGETEKALIKYVVMDGDAKAAEIDGPATMRIKVANAKLWTPESPHLYGLRVTYLGDTVESYFGMRKVHVGKDEKGINRLMLNNKPVFHAGPLDQGYWPDGIYTAPTDEALKYDIEITKKLGFNATRKHVKVEPARWYYHCDKLGLLVWQDMPSSREQTRATKTREGTPFTAEAGQQFERELKAMVEGLHNHPSIVMWVVFNEGWGQYDTERLTKWTKELDPSRIVSNASGWHDRAGVGDVVDMHNYPLANMPPVEEKRAAVLGEFGGFALPVEKHMWVNRSWGYQTLQTQAALERKYFQVWRQVWKLKEQGLSAAIYTQLTDVETEANGLLTYDRRVIKLDVDRAFAAVAKGEFPPEPVYVQVVATAEKEPVEWAYTMTEPEDTWRWPEGDVSQWKKGNGGFGKAGTPGAIVGTQWVGDNTTIWIRRDIVLPDAIPEGLALRVHHDEEASIYLNGQLAAKVTGFTTEYEVVDISENARKNLKPGKNVLAVVCKNTGGGQYIDVGLVMPEKK
jgi:hypothetical protein